jgi:hypothetical protein
MANISLTNNMCCIIIPIYKDVLTDYEILSLKQCCHILFKYSIIFVTHKNLDCSVYTRICKDAGVNFKYELFNQKYFKDILCYDALLLSRFFYARFIEYEYMLIYHLDAYVFRDELDFWCGKGYDYIGAPWLRLNKEKTMPEFYDPPAVGNGGFSLRNIKSSIKKHTIKMTALSFIHLLQSYYNKLSLKYKKNVLILIPRVFLKLTLNSLKYTFFQFDYKTNDEDDVWASLFLKKGNVPPAIEAMKFSFENYPEYLYGLNNSKLPFGCHNWSLYNNYPFFKKYINLQFS